MSLQQLALVPVPDGRQSRGRNGHFDAAKVSVICTEGQDSHGDIVTQEVWIEVESSRPGKAAPAILSLSPADALRLAFSLIAGVTISPHEPRFCLEILGVDGWMVMERSERANPLMEKVSDGHQLDPWQDYRITDLGGFVISEWDRGSQVWNDGE